MQLHGNGQIQFAYVIKYYTFMRVCVFISFTTAEQQKRFDQFYSLLVMFAMKYIGLYFSTEVIRQPEDHWSCIAHLSAEDILKLAVIEEKKFNHSPRVGGRQPIRAKI